MENGSLAHSKIIGIVVPSPLMQHILPYLVGASAPPYISSRAGFVILHGFLLHSRNYRSILFLPFFPPPSVPNLCC